MKKVKPFFNNLIVKAILITIVPFSIGLIDNATSWKNAQGNFINIWESGKFWEILISLLYIIYVIYIAFQEKKMNDNVLQIELVEKEKEKYALESETYQMLIDSLNNILHISQKDIYDLSKKIRQTDNLDLLKWNFESVANYICNDIVSVMKKVALSGDDITANIYIRVKVKTQGASRTRTKDYIRMIAHAGGTNSEPSILYKDIDLNKKKVFQYAKLFLDNNPKIVVYSNKEEIKNNFKYNGNPNKYDDEYTQYIGIPISCSAGNIMSSIEIISHHGTIIAEEKSEIVSIINKYILVYRNYALLTQKVEKGLKAKKSSVEDGSEIL